MTTTMAAQFAELDAHNRPAIRYLQLAMESSAAVMPFNEKE